MRPLLDLKIKINNFYRASYILLGQGMPSSESPLSITLATDADRNKRACLSDSVSALATEHSA